METTETKSTTITQIINSVVTFAEGVGTYVFVDSLLSMFPAPKLGRIGKLFFTIGRMTISTAVTTATLTALSKSDDHSNNGNLIKITLGTDHKDVKNTEKKSETKDNGASCFAYVVKNEEQE